MSIVVKLTLWFAFVGANTGFTPPSSLHNHNKQHSSKIYDSSRIIVVGKIILDKYGNPDDGFDDDSKVTIGGGGPQAAWGACASTAVRDLLLNSKGDKWELTKVNKDDAEPPPKQNISFLAPIGTKNWTPEMSDALNGLLPMLERPPYLITSHEHITPTINIWHDENEMVNWKPVNGSFGDEGADGLWRNRPKADDILDVIHGYEGDITLHAILEAGSNPTGKGEDALPFFNSTLMNRVSTTSIEPIVFPDETGNVSREDSNGVISLIERVQACIKSDSCKQKEQDKTMLIISPDRPCYDALFLNTKIKHNNMHHNKMTEFAVRNGANGSFINGDSLIIPSATLKTFDRKPINPTGAGNAYSGAYAACRGSGSSALEAACLANGIGAVFCEYEHMPPWSWNVLERVAEAAIEVRNKVNIDQ